MGEMWWSVDPLEKVFCDAVPPSAAETRVVIEGARNEWVSGQAVFRSSDANWMGAALSATELVGAGGTLAPPSVKYVGFVPVRSNTGGTPEEHLVRQAPALFPDPLLDDDWLHLKQNCAQPVWVTAKIPADAAPGMYRGEIRIRSRDGLTASIELELSVHPAVLPEERTLAVTNWFSLRNIAHSHGVELFSEGFWSMLDAYARTMGEHRQNTVITPVRQLVRPVLEDGELALDFSLFDRYVELFDRHGVAQLIEGGHLGGRGGQWDDGFVVYTWKAAGTDIEEDAVAAGSADADLFLAWFLPALREHLEAKGWAQRYIQHLADEPVDANAASYSELVRSVRRHWPELPIVEANMCQSIDPLDIWVPILNVWHENYSFYEERRSATQDIWFYTCLGPTGTYANRLIDYPLLKVRYLHWLNARYGATGYLHWGLNYWDGVASPFADVEPAHTPKLVLPPGDCGIVYPGARGPLSSIRFEAMRDGIQDYELLMQLDVDTRTELASELIRDFDAYNLSTESFRQVRRRLLDAVVNIQ